MSGKHAHPLRCCLSPMSLDSFCPRAGFMGDRKSSLSASGDTKDRKRGTQEKNQQEVKTSMG